MMKRIFTTVAIMAALGCAPAAPDYNPLGLAPGEPNPNYDFAHWINCGNEPATDSGPCAGYKERWAPYEEAEQQRQNSYPYVPPNYTEVSPPSNNDDGAALLGRVGGVPIGRALAPRTYYYAPPLPLPARTSTGRAPSGLVEVGKRRRRHDRKG